MTCEFKINDVDGVNRYDSKGKWKLQVKVVVEAKVVMFYWTPLQKKKKKHTQTPFSILY